MDASSTHASPSATTFAPRWEWRTFGESLSADERIFATPEAVQESDEVYLLAETGESGTDRSAGAQSAKIRDGLIDIKTLNEVDARGLEQWNPTMKEAFPLSAENVSRVFEALRIAAPSLERSEYSMEQFLDELMEPTDGVRVIRVHKLRRRYTVNGCMAEVSDVVADGKRTRTIAVESTDADAVMTAVRVRGPGAAPQRQLPAGPLDPRRRVGAAVRRDRRRHQLGEAPRRRARGRWVMEAIGRPRRHEPAGRRIDPRRRHRCRAAGPHRCRDRGHGRRRSAGGSDPARRRRHRRPAIREKRQGGRRRDRRSAPGSRSRSSAARRRRVSPISRPRSPRASARAG